MQLLALYLTHFLLSSTRNSIGAVHTGSSSVLWNFATYGCARAFSAVMRLVGLKHRQQRIMSSASADVRAKMCDRARGCRAVNFSSMVLAKGEFIALTSFVVGRPVTSMILSSWFMVPVPGKSGFPSSISPKMQPTDHISTPLE